MTRYFALDVETANAEYSSICQVGLASFENGKMIGGWKTYVDPEDYFDWINISIHGINEDTVRGAPKIPETVNLLRARLAGNIVVHHTAFDRLSLEKAASRFNLQPLNVRWLDSARVARRTWNQFQRAGYGLSNLAEHFEIKFKHHDALEDARAAGEILWRAINDSGRSAEEWLELAYTKSRADIRCFEANREGAFYGESIVFTGALSMPRSKASEQAAKLGCTVETGVTTKTTMLVIGTQDLKKLAGKDKSNKHRHAEELILNGQEIRILREADFLEMIEKY